MIEISTAAVNMERKEHWESVYRRKRDQDVSWYRDHLENSLRLIKDTGVGRDASIIDIGGGSSTLVDDLIEEGYADLSVLDISSEALQRSRERLGSKAEDVEWLVADVTEVDLPPGRYDVWHDRAVFHFLTDKKEREKYIDLVMRSVKPGGHIIIASFGTNGPTRCSGLEVVRYSPEAIHNEFGKDFTVVKDLLEEHRTPSGSIQEFVYCYCRKIA